MMFPPWLKPPTSAKPLGFWRCTVSADWARRHFEPGRVYECRPDNLGGPRIYPDSGGGWAPYWQPHNQRFCYPAYDLDFEYLGTARPPDLACKGCEELAAELELAMAALARASEIMAKAQREFARLSDSGGLPQGEDPLGAECEASQSGAAETAHRPKGVA